MIKQALTPLLTEGLLPCISVWGATFCPFDQTTTCEAFRLYGWEDTKIQIGASEFIQFQTSVPAWEFEEDGQVIHEPGGVQDHSYRFLSLESRESRELSSAATHKIAIGSLEGIDLLFAEYDIPFPSGTESRTVLAGLRFRLKEGYYGGHEASFAILQRRPNDTIEIGAASRILANLPAHIKAPQDITNLS